MKGWVKYNQDQLEGDFNILLKNGDTVFGCWAGKGFFITHDSVWNPKYHGKNIDNSEVVYVKQTTEREFKCPAA